MHSPMFTLEVFPPKRNAPVGTIYDILDGLEGLNPDRALLRQGQDR